MSSCTLTPSFGPRTKLTLAYFCLVGQLVAKQLVSPHYMQVRKGRDQPLLGGVQVFVCRYAYLPTYLTRFSLQKKLRLTKSEARTVVRSKLCDEAKLLRKKNAVLNVV